MTQLILSDPGMKNKSILINPEANIPNQWEMRGRGYTQAVDTKRKITWSKTINGDPWAPGSLCQRIEREIGGGILLDVNTRQLRDLENEGWDIASMAEKFKKSIIRTTILRALRAQDTSKERWGAPANLLAQDFVNSLR